MIGGSTSSSTNSGASSTLGNPGINPRMMPVITSRIAPGTLSRASTMATAAITVSSSIKVWILGIMPGESWDRMRPRLPIGRHVQCDYMGRKARDACASDLWRLGFLIRRGLFDRRVEQNTLGRDQLAEAVADRVPIDDVDPIRQVALFEPLSQQRGFIEAERPPDVDQQVKIGITPRPPRRPRAKDPDLRRWRQ